MIVLGHRQQRRIAIGAGAGVQVEDHDVRRLLGEGGKNVVQRAVGPDRAAAAVEQAIGEVVLAGLDDRRDAGIAAVRLHRRRERLVGPVAAGPFPLVTDEGGMEFGVAGVLGRISPPVDEIAIEVDIVLVDAARPGHTPRVDQMNDQDSRVVRQAPGTAFGKPGRLAGRAVWAFNAMRTRDQHHQPGRVATAEEGHVGEKGFAARTVQRMAKFVKFSAGFLCGGDEARAQGRVVNRVSRHGWHLMHAKLSQVKN